MVSGWKNRNFEILIFHPVMTKTILKSQNFLHNGNPKCSAMWLVAAALLIKITWDFSLEKSSSGYLYFCDRVAV